MFFHEEYAFKGKHARYVKILKNSLFNRNVDILILSPILGLVYNRKSNPDTTAENSEEVPTKIFAETMIRENSKILYNYRLCMLLSDEYSDQEKRDNAFKYYTGEDQDHMEEFNKSIELYNSYILGGVEILYEIMLKNNTEYNGDSQNIKYQKKIISDVTEFISDYKEYIDEMNEISNDIDLL